jgi:hypothetical protein
MSFQTLRGIRFPALCGDGKVRSAVVTALAPWSAWAISASVQVTVKGKRRTVTGNLCGIDTALDKAPPGVSYRFASNALTDLVGFTRHKPVAPVLKKLLQRAHGETGVDALSDFAFMTAAALFEIHGETVTGYRPGAGNGEPFTRGDWQPWQRDTVRNLSAGTLQRLCRLSWRAYKSKSA